MWRLGTSVHDVPRHRGGLTDRLDPTAVGAIILRSNGRPRARSTSLAKKPAPISYCQGRVRPILPEPVGRGFCPRWEEPLPTDPEHPVGRRVRLGGHDLVDEPAEWLDPGGGLAAACTWPRCTSHAAR
jgi:hypothetical protein